VERKQQADFPHHACHDGREFSCLLHPTKPPQTCERRIARPRSAHTRRPRSALLRRVGTFKKHPSLLMLA
jgi:hypothetical protein